MTTISAAILADSVSPDGIRLTTLHLRYPRMIHAEFMTHRVFSRNARSSRAVPVETLIREVEADPVIPLHWGANQKGMQADRECDAAVGLALRDDRPHKPVIGISRESAWLRARDEAVRHARAFHEAGYHKQVVNRLLEPFMHIDVVVTATEWANFLALRDHHMAEPHIAILARQVKAAFAASEPRLRLPGLWHLPYVRADEFELPLDVQIKLSVARCARISYQPFDGNASIEAEIARHDALVGAVPMHASPAEHQATPDIFSHTTFEDGKPPLCVWENSHEHGNLRGWRQYRKTLAGENLAEALS